MIQSTSLNFQFRQTREPISSFGCFTILVFLYAAILFFVFKSSQLGEGFFKRFTNIISYISTFIPVAIVLVITIELGGAIAVILVGWVKDKLNKEKEEQINQAVNFLHA